MKKWFRTILAAILCAVLALPVTAGAVEDITMADVSLSVGESQVITPAFHGGFTYTYASSDESVAVVDAEGTVTGADDGVCYVTARCWYGETLVGSTATLVTVGTGAGTAVHYDRELVLTKTPVGNTGAVIAVTGAAGPLTAESSNGDIASVSVEGETVTVTGAEGAAGVVTVTVSDGTRTNAVEVPVGYTTFVFDGTDITVIDGSDSNYEIAAITASQEGEAAVASSETDDNGNAVYSVPEGYTALQAAIKKKGGTYVFQGTGTDGAIAVKKEASKDAVLLLDGLDLTSSFTSPVTVKKDSTASVTLTALLGTGNTLADSAFNNADVYGDAESDGGDGTNAYYAESAVIKCKAGSDVILNGGGTLTLTGGAKNGIKAANLLTVEGLTLHITAPDNGISGENRIDLQGADITVETQAGDAIKCEDDTETIGAITITGGTLDLTAGNRADGAAAEGDGIQAAAALTIYGGAFSVTAGGGTANSAYLAVQSAGKGDNVSSSAQAAAAALASCKGLKSGGELTIYDGTFTVDAADDALHADTDLTIYGGDFAITSGDDGVHAEYVLRLGVTGAANDALTMTAGSASVSCYEGLEGAAIYIYSGTYAIYASDDAFNAANGDLSSYTYSIEIDGGVLTACSSAGDGLDSNGNLTICAGAAVQVFAADSRNAALDYGDKQSDTMSFGFTEGGSVLAVGSSSMATTPDNGLYVAFGGRSGGGGQWPGMQRPQQPGSGGSLSSSISLSDGDTVVLKNSSGEELISARVSLSAGTANYLLYAGPDLTSGDTVSLYVNGSSTASATASVSGSAYTCTPSASGTGEDTPVLAIGETAAVSAPAPDLQYVFSVDDETVVSCEAVSTEAGDSAAVRVTGLTGGSTALTAVLHAGGVAIGSGTCQVTVSGGSDAAVVEKPAPELYRTATGETITLLESSADYTISGENAGTDAGVYTVTVTLNDPDAQWSDGTADPLTFTWCICTGSASQEGVSVYLCGDQLLAVFTEEQTGTTAFAAWYSAGSRLLEVRAAAAGGGSVTLANAAPEDAAALGVFAVNDSGAPVCAALRMDLV